MPRITVAAFESVYLSSLSGFIDTLQMANAHARKQLGSSASAFQWQVVSQFGESVTGSGNLSVNVDGALETASPTEIIYIPSFFYPGAQQLPGFVDRQRALIDWISDQWASGATVAANCTATFLLAETGLLNGRRATTTWWLEKQFRKRYRKVCLDVRALITEQERLICAGATTSYLSLAIRFAERYISAPVACLTAKTMLVDVGRTDQAAYATLREDAAHNDQLVARAQYWLQQRLSTNVSVQALADQLGVSQRTLIRRFNATLRTTPRTYLQTLRIENARCLLETTNLGIKEIVERVGYLDANSFSRLFQKRLGLTPGAYRARLQRKQQTGR